jgi:hypothetical protein
VTKVKKKIKNEINCTGKRSVKFHLYDSKFNYSWANRHDAETIVKTELKEGLGSGFSVSVYKKRRFHFDYYLIYVSVVGPTTPRK